ncbi:MAG: type VI secretion system protein TssA [Planctomycetota bacterium]|jgi:type VI secretion system protein VasJ
MAQLDEAPILALGADPIPGGDPAGGDATEDEQYIEAMAEFAKHGRIESDEPEWYDIEQNCMAVLKSKSKDVEIASVLGHALFKRYSYAGLAAALGLIHAMVTNFWDGLQPARPRRRKARIETLGDQFVDGLWFRENQPGPNDFDALDVCVERAGQLKDALTGHMPDEPPEFRKFIEGLKDHAGKRPKEAPKPDPAAAPAAGGDARAPAAAGAAGSFAAPEVGDVSGAVNAVLSACNFIKKAEPTNPLPYAVARFVKWASISLPTSDDAKFQIPAPEANALEALPHQLNNQLWDHLLKTSESAFRANDPLWLDLQRFTCAAMAGLGPAYNSARDAIMGLTGALVHRLGAGIYELRFANGTPLCSGETRMWIESELASGDSGGGGGAGASAGNGKLSEASDKAKKLAGSGKLKEGLKELQDGLATCTQRRDRFLWRLKIAQLCFDSQKLQLAAPLLEECSEDIKKYRIDEWEPSLAVEVASTLYRCRKALMAATKDQRPEALECVRDSFAWLCQLDPLAALAAEPSGN